MAYYVPPEAEDPPPLTEEEMLEDIVAWERAELLERADVED
jgi:hypothetical protein